MNSNHNSNLSYYILDILENSDEYLENHIEWLKGEIDIRIESLQQELENIKMKYYDKLETVKTTIKWHLNRLIKRKEFEDKSFKTLIEQLNSMNKESEDYTNFISNNNEKLNEFMEKLKTYKSEFNDLFSKVSFEPNQASFADDIVGKIESDLFIGETVKYKTYKQRALVECKQASSMCSIDDKYLLVTDKRSNKILKYNTNFEVCEQITTIERMKFDRPSLITSDEIDHVYICNANNSQIIISDLKMKTIKCILGYTSDEMRTYDSFDFIKDIKFSGQNLYVLDASALSIHVFSKEGEFKERFELFKSNEQQKHLNNPLAISVFENVIAVLDDYEYVYMYTNKGELIQKMSFEHIGFIKSICFANNYFFVHAGDGAFICYKLNYMDEDDNCNKFSLVFEREINSLRETSEDMIYFNKHVTIMLPYEKIFGYF